MRPAAPALVLLPTDESTRIEPPPAGLARRVVVVVPEDQSDPWEANRLEPADGTRIALHAAHAVACLTGLLQHDEDFPLAPAEFGDHAGEVQFVRCHSRLIDAGYVADALTARTFASRRSWPNPEPRSFQPDGLSDEVADAVVAKYFARNAEVFDLREAKPEPAPPEPRDRLIPALRAIAAFFLAELRARPWRWLDHHIEGFWDERMVPLVDRLGSGAGVKLVHWHEPGDDPDLSPTEFMARRLPEVIPGPAGPTAAAWRDAASIASGLIDGSELSFSIPELLSVNSDRRLVELRPALIAPDPRDPPPIDEHGIRACDPIAVAAAIAALEMQLAAEPAGAPTTEGAPGSSAEERLRALREWYEQRRGSLLWRVGEEIADRMQRARDNEKARPTNDDWQSLEDQINQDKKRELKRAHRRRPWFIARVAVAGAAIAALLASHLSSSIKPFGVAAIVLVWFLWLLRGWWSSRKRSTVGAESTLEQAAGLVLRSVQAATARGDAGPPRGTV